MRIPGHLYKNRFGTYYFRIVVPLVDGDVFLTNTRDRALFGFSAKEIKNE